MDWCFHHFWSWSVSSESLSDRACTTTENANYYGPSKCDANGASSTTSSTMSKSRWDGEVDPTKGILWLWVKARDLEQKVQIWLVILTGNSINWLFYVRVDDNYFCALASKLTHVLSEIRFDYRVHSGSCAYTCTPRVGPKLQFISVGRSQMKPDSSCFRVFLLDRLTKSFRVFSRLASPTFL